jgi:hypothetical protein
MGTRGRGGSNDQRAGKAPRAGRGTVLVKRAATILEMATSVVALATGMKIEIRDELGPDASFPSQPLRGVAREQRSVLRGVPLPLVN